MNKHWLVKSLAAILLWAATPAARAQEEGTSTVQQHKMLQELYKRDVARARDHAARKEMTKAGPSMTSTTRLAAIVSDTDDDGMPDDWETAHGLNSLDPNDAWPDRDGDYVINLFEYQLGSDPNNASTPTIRTVAAGQNVGSAIASAANGEVLRVQAGIYQLNYRTFNPKTIMIQGGWNSSFMAREESPFATVFDGSAQDSTEVLYFSFGSGAHAVILEGLTFMNGSGHFGTLNLLAENNVLMKWSLMNCAVLHSMTAKSYGGAIHAHHWDRSKVELFMMRCLVANNDCDGIYNQTVGGAIGRWKVIHASAANNQSDASGKGYGITGFTLDSARLEINFKNAIVWKNQKPDLEFSGWGASVVINGEYSNIGNISTFGAVIFDRGEGVIDRDPSFVDPAHDDFNLSAGSPCIDAGIDLGLPFFGSAPDMGALERTLTSVEQRESAKIEGYSLLQSYPNPFNPSTMIRYALPQPGHVKLVIYDLLGAKIRTLVDGRETAGFKQITWDGMNDRGERVPSGVYVYRMEAGEFVRARKLTVMK